MVDHKNTCSITLNIAQWHTISFIRIHNTHKKTPEKLNALDTYNRIFSFCSCFVYVRVLRFVKLKSTTSQSSNFRDKTSIKVNNGTAVKVQCTLETQKLGFSYC